MLIAMTILLYVVLCVSQELFERCVEHVPHFPDAEACKITIQSLRKTSGIHVSRGVRDGILEGPDSD